MLPTLEQLLAEKARRSLYQFVKQAWHVVEPGTQYVDSWHIETICRHLQAVTEGKIRRLIINIPPRSMKSTIVSVMWPAWEWISYPERRFLSASYAAELSVRDAVRSRRIIDSAWYRRNYGHVFRLSSDQNVKSRYENDKTGYRISTSVDGGATGEGGNRLLIDDPHNVKETFSDTIRRGVLTWWDESMSTRYNQPAEDAAVIIMQRVHMDDLTGHLLSKGGWQHLCLPMEFDGVRRSTVLGEYDQRVEIGALLWPTRFTPEVVAQMKTEMGSYAASGQLQQNPVPVGGTIFKRDRWQYYKALPELDESIISIDCTFKDLATSDYVAIQVWGRKGANKYLIHRAKERLSFTGTVQMARQVKAAFPKTVAVLIEDKANGPAVIEMLRNEVPGVLAVNPQGGKVARAYAIQPQQEAQNLWLPDASLAPWVNDYLAELTAFPAAPNDDEVDATTQAITWFQMRGDAMGLFAYYRDEASKLAEAKQGQSTMVASPPSTFMQ